MPIRAALGGHIHGFDLQKQHDDGWECARSSCVYVGVCGILCVLELLLVYFYDCRARVWRGDSALCGLFVLLVNQSWTPDQTGAPHYVTKPQMSFFLWFDAQIRISFQQQGGQAAVTFQLFITLSPLKKDFYWALCLCKLTLSEVQNVQSGILANPKHTTATLLWTPKAKGLETSSIFGDISNASQTTSFLNYTRWYCNCGCLALFID